MTEIEKIAYTKYFIDKLANGINPLDNTPIPENELLNNIRISRCMFYVSDILRQVIENGGVQKKKSTPKIPFSISDEQLSRFPYSDQPMPVSRITEGVNSLIDTDIMKKLPYSDITDWLISIGVLKTVQTSEGKSVKRPTERAYQLGITLELRQGQYNSYYVVLYNRQAQELIIDNMQAILSYKSSKDEQSAPEAEGNAPDGC